MDYREEAGLAQAQACLFELLAHCFRRPDASLAATLSGSGLSKEFSAVLSGGGSRAIASALERLAVFERRCSSETLENVRLALEVDYNRLFVGPASLLAPPYESYYASDAEGKGFGRLRTAEERAVVAAYRESGYEVPGFFTDLPDHIAVELEFLSLLAGNEACAWGSGDVDEAEGTKRAQANFIERHTSTWVARFAECVERGARTALYPAAAQIAAMFCGR